MLNLTEGAMGDKENVVAPVVQQTYSAKYCKVRRLNHLHLVEFLTADADTEYVAMLIDQSCRHSDKLIRWEPYIVHAWIVESLHQWRLPSFIRC